VVRAGEGGEVVCGVGSRTSSTPDGVETSTVFLTRARRSGGSVDAISPGFTSKSGTDSAEEDEHARIDDAATIAGLDHQKLLPGGVGHDSSELNGDKIAHIVVVDSGVLESLHDMGSGN
jgi:hypothetical protein